VRLGASIGGRTETIVAASRARGIVELLAGPYFAPRTVVLEAAMKKWGINDWDRSGAVKSRRIRKNGDGKNDIGG